MKNGIYLGVQFFNPQEGVLGNVGWGGWVSLNTTVDQRTRRHQRPGNIQKPLGELRPSDHQSRFNIAICMEQHGPVNYVLGLSSHLTGWVSLLCSLFEGKGHAFFNSTGALCYSPCLLALLSSRTLLSITRLTGFKCIKDGHAAQRWLGHTHPHKEPFRHHASRSADGALLNCPELNGSGFHFLLGGKQKRAISSD